MRFVRTRGAVWPRPTCTRESAQVPPSELAEGFATGLDEIKTPSNFDAEQVADQFETIDSRVPRRARIHRGPKAPGRSEPRVPEHRMCQRVRMVPFGRRRPRTPLGGEGSDGLRGRAPTWAGPRGERGAWLDEPERGVGPWPTAWGGRAPATSRAAWCRGLEQRSAAEQPRRFRYRYAGALQAVTPVARGGEIRGVDLIGRTVVVLLASGRDFGYLWAGDSRIDLSATAG